MLWIAWGVPLVFIGSMIFLGEKGILHPLVAWPIAGVAIFLIPLTGELILRILKNFFPPPPLDENSFSTTKSRKPKHS